AHADRPRRGPLHCGHRDARPPRGGGARGVPLRERRRGARRVGEPERLDAQHRRDRERRGERARPHAPPRARRRGCIGLARRAGALPIHVGAGLRVTHEVRMRRLLTLLALSIAATAAPAAAQDTTGTIDPGMSKAQVIARLGKPVSERSDGVYTFMYYKNGCEKTCGMQDLVVLEND